MKHTDFHAAYKAIEALERTELIAALNAHGGSFEAPDYRKAGLDEVIIVGAFEDSEYSEDILFTRAEINPYDNSLVIYGMPLEPAFEDEPVKFIEFGYIYKIIKLISETNLVSDTRKDARNKATMRNVREALGRSV